MFRRKREPPPPSSLPEARINYYWDGHRLQRVPDNEDISSRYPEMQPAEARLPATAVSAPSIEVLLGHLDQVDVLARDIAWMSRHCDPAESEGFFIVFRHARYTNLGPTVEIYLEGETVRQSDPKVSARFAVQNSGAPSDLWPVGLQDPRWAPSVRDNSGLAAVMALLFSVFRLKLNRKAASELSQRVLAGIWQVLTQIRDLTRPLREVDEFAFIHYYTSSMLGPQVENTRMLAWHEVALPLLWLSLASSLGVDHADWKGAASIRDVNSFPRQPEEFVVQFERIHEEAGGLLTAERTAPAVAARQYVFDGTKLRRAPVLYRAHAVYGKPSQSISPSEGITVPDLPAFLNGISTIAIDGMEWFLRNCVPITGFYTVFRPSDHPLFPRTVNIHAEGVLMASRSESATTARILVVNTALASEWLYEVEDDYWLPSVDMGEVASVLDLLLRIFEVRLHAPSTGSDNERFQSWLQERSTTPPQDQPPDPLFIKWIILDTRQAMLRELHRIVQAEVDEETDDWDRDELKFILKYTKGLIKGGSEMTELSIHLLWRCLGLAYLRLIGVAPSRPSTIDTWEGYLGKNDYEREMDYDQYELHERAVKKVKKEQERAIRAQEENKQGEKGKGAEEKGKKAKKKKKGEKKATEGKREDQSDERLVALARYRA